MSIRTSPIFINRLFPSRRPCTAFIQATPFQDLCFGAECFYFMSHKKIFISIAVVLISIGVFAYVPRESAAPDAMLETTTTTEATITVGETRYPITPRVGETLFEVMQSLSSTGSLEFAGREFPGLGFFVDSMNGRKNMKGDYWVFYVNGTPASFGVSAITLHAGDLIEWKYEKGY